MNEHAQLVRALTKSPLDIVMEIDEHKMGLLHMVVGVVGEAGEALEHVKKSTIHNKPLDRCALINELGDIEFYLEGLRQCLGVTREECLNANIEKLNKRYSEGRYNERHAMERVDTKGKA